MQFSIKPPGAFLWKTGYTEVKIRSCLQSGRITGDWLVCPLGEAARAVTVTEFIDNPSILNELNDVPSERSSGFAEEPQTPLSVAALGWWVSQEARLFNENPLAPGIRMGRVGAR